MADDTLARAIGLIQAGKIEAARELLELILKSDQTNIPAWHWYVQTWPGKKEKTRIWQACLRYNPGNEQAQQALKDLQVKSETPVPAELQKPVSAVPKRGGSCFLRGLLWGLIGLLGVIAAVTWWLAGFMPKNPEKYRHVQPVEYYLYVPKAYSAEKEWPLFIGMHSLGGNGLDCWYLWQRFAEKEGFILLCPSVPWTTGYDKGLGEATVWSAITEIKKDYRLQPRMFLNGVLLGGVFVQDFACDYPGSVSGLSLLSSPEYVRPELFPELIPMLVVIGDREDPHSRNASLAFANGLQNRGFEVKHILLPNAGYAIIPDELNWTIDLFRKTIGK